MLPGSAGHRLPELYHICIGGAGHLTISRSLHTPREQKQGRVPSETRLGVPHFPNHPTTHARIITQKHIAASLSRSLAVCTHSELSEGKSGAQIGLGLGMKKRPRHR